MNLYIILLVIIILIIIFTPPGSKTESFDIERKPVAGGPIQVGTLNNTPAPIADLMKSLNIGGGQMMADSQYDKVDESILKKAKQ